MTADGILIDYLSKWCASVLTYVCTTRFVLISYKNHFKKTIRVAVEREALQLLNIPTDGIFWQDYPISLNSRYGNFIKRKTISDYWSMLAITGSSSIIPNPRVGSLVQSERFSSQS